MGPVCRIIEASKVFGEIVYRHLDYTDDEIKIYFQGNGTFVYGCVKFSFPYGLRILDERDLCEFWSDYNEKIGWLYEVESGGWKDLERSRGRFLTLEMIPNMKEYLMVGDTCFSVFCKNEPEIINLGCNPKK